MTYQIDRAPTLPRQAGAHRAVATVAERIIDVFVRRYASDVANVMTRLRERTVKINTYSAAALRESYGIDLAGIDVGSTARLEIGAAWTCVAPGQRSVANQHDEIETWVVVAGQGDVIVDAQRHPVSPATVVQFEPFETHSAENTGETDLILATFYWRDSDHAVRVASGGDHRRFGERPIFVFSSAPTPNGDLHLGHLSGPFFGADVFVRYQRMTGANAWHITGSDDFQSYVAAAARREGREPAETAAYYSDEILATLAMMDIEVHQYTATSRAAGYPAALQAFFSRVAAAPAVTTRDMPGLFDGETGQYLYEAHVAGGCPTCGSDSGGNICEACREPNFCVDLVEPRATASEARPREGSITQYTLSLHELSADVAAHHRLGKVPASVKELAGRLFSRERLDVAITHPSQWGVSPAPSSVEGQVIWVWLDLAFNFLHSIEELGNRRGTGWRADAPQADWKIVHFLGSDGSFFHPIFFPALYRLAYPDWAPDIDYNINEFYELDGSKFSTSRRHAIWGKDILSPQSVDAVRCYLALTRPEGRRTNFELSAYEAFVQEALIDGWQRWLNDLGDRIETQYGGIAPDAGIWTPEHTAFLARLGTRLSALTGSLGQNGFSLNRAAETLHGIVEDVTSFARLERPLAEIDGCKDESRTAIALELAAAQLLATCSAPVMPRFANHLADALGGSPPTEWPRTVTLVKPGARIDLAGRTFFVGSPEPSPLLPWLSGLVRSALRLQEDEPVHDRTLVGLGMESLQAIALQYQLSEQVGADISVEDLLGSRDVAEIANLLADGLSPEMVAARAEGLPG
jgi:methionyl-tRNA synthetase